jgi:predicted acetyltransferase
VNVTLAPAAPEDRAVLDNLWQLYVYDFSEMMDLALRDDGRFEGRAFDAYWVDPWRHPFLLRVDGALAGFALVHAGSRLTGDVEVFDMVEFFVARRYRRCGVGRRAACAVFDRFPGRWEVRQHPSNAGATAFWRRVIGGYTEGDYEELAWSDPSWTGTVQRFRAEAAPQQVRRSYYPPSRGGAP